MMIMCSSHSMNVWYTELQEGEFIYVFGGGHNNKSLLQRERGVLEMFFLNYELKAFQSHLTMGVNRFGR